MSIELISGGVLLPTPPGRFGTSNFTNNITMQTNNQGHIALIFRVPKTGTLDSFEFRLGTVADTPDNGIRLSFQDVNSSNNPDLTQDQFCDVTSAISTDQWIVPPGPLTHDGTSGGTKRSVTLGDYVCAVVSWAGAYVASDSWIVVGVTQNATIQTLNIPRDAYNAHTTNNGSSWTRNQNVMSLALKYDDGTYAFISPYVYPFKTRQSETFSSASATTERGLYFRLPFSYQCDGAWARCSLFGASLDIVLYDSDGTTVLGSQNFNDTTGGVIFSSTECNLSARWAPVTLLANTYYRVVVKPGATSCILWDFNVESNAHLTAVEGGSDWIYTMKTSGSWSEPDNTRRPFMGIRMSGVDIGSGSAEVAHVF